MLRRPTKAENVDARSKERSARQTSRRQLQSVSPVHDTWVQVSQAARDLDGNAQHLQPRSTAIRSDSLRPAYAYPLLCRDGGSPALLLGLAKPLAGATGRLLPSAAAPPGSFRTAPEPGTACMHVGVLLRQCARKTRWRARHAHFDRFLARHTWTVGGRPRAA
jgi:hypothetical protein